MLRTWKNNYVEEFAKTLVLSKAASLIFFVISIVEAIAVMRAIQNADDVSPEAIFRASVSPLVFFVVFGVRSAYLHLGKLNIVGIALTWWLCATAVYTASTFALYGCVLTCDPNANYPVYDLFS